MDKGRCLLIQSGLPKNFWVEATCTAAYLINRSPLTAIKKKTPMEMWSGHPSDYGMLRIFGYVTYSRVKQGKLKPIEDRVPRIRMKPLRFRDESNMATYAFVAAEEEDTHEPLTYQEAVAFEECSKLKIAKKEERDSLRKKKTWELVDHPAGQKLVSCKWLFKIKEGIKCVQKPRYKVWLVARGFTQRAGIDYNVVFSLVVQDTSIQVILALMAFLHGNLKEVIYMKQPQRYAIGSTKSLLKKEFVMKELGEAKKILGIEIVKDRSRNILRVSQSGINNVPYVNEVGSLMYLMVCTRPDIAYAITTNVGLVYRINHGNHVEVIGFVDPDYAKDLDKGRVYGSYRGCEGSYMAKVARNRVRILAKDSSEYCYRCLVKGYPSLRLTEIWDALRAAAESEIQLAQAIVSSAGIIVQNLDMTLCYDERAIATQLESMETLKEDVAALKSHIKIRGKSHNDNHGESSWRPQHHRPCTKIDFLAYARGDLRGDALDLFSWLLADQTITLWGQLVLTFEKFFGPAEFQNPDEYLCSIKQTGYIQEFRTKTPINHTASEEESDDQEGFAKISLHVIFGKTNVNTMKLQGTIGTTEVLILVDGGSTHNFISNALVRELKMVIVFVTPFGVQIRNGDIIRSRPCSQCNDLVLGVQLRERTLFSIEGATLNIVLGDIVT
ncbi:retrotransposon protein, putative, ty1-copia subclass, partial [Tanacetum coccineum]